jgi:hypothetical protein
MKSFMFLVVSLGITLTANLANACSYAINEVKKSAELQSVALGSIDGEKILSSAVSKFSYFESKPTPMCPDELTYNAIVSATYEVGMNVCSVELKIKKVESWTTNDLDTYSVTGRQSARCKKK